jgi:hypothetical protein
MTIEAIKEAIEQLTEPERRKLAEWLEELEDQAWDAEMENDLSPGGRGDHLAKKVGQEIENGKFSSLQEGLRARQKPR